MNDLAPIRLSQPLDHAFALEAVTEAAAIAAHAGIGRGDEHAADQAAAEAMRAALNGLAIEGKVVIGEGERDEAPILFVGETLGQGGLAVEIGLDPLEGSTLTAKGMANALSVMAMTAPGGLLAPPNIYMQTLAIGPGYAEDLFDLDATPGDNINAMAKAKGVRPQDIRVLVMDRPRHERLIAAIRKAGAAVKLAVDGYISGILETTDDSTGVDMYMGAGGAPEIVLAGAALRCIGGQIQARFQPRDEMDRAAARAHGLDDLNRKYRLADLVTGDVVFAATGVTDGTLLRGIRRQGGVITSESVVMYSASGTTRRIRSRHPAHG